LGSAGKAVRRMASKDQITIFDLMDKLKEKPDKKTHLLKVGDEIGRVVLGELRAARITSIEGLPYHPFYRTDRGVCYSYKEGLHDIEELRKLAESERSKYKTICPCSLEKRLTVEYAPRSCDGYVTWGQIGIYENMLFWKQNCTYQFLEPYENEKQLAEAYKKRKAELLTGDYKIVEKEHEMQRLYWSRHGFYAAAEYVEFNG